MNDTAAQVLFTFAQAAQMTTLPESWLRKAVTDRRIPFCKLGKHVRFSQRDLDSLISGNAVAPTVSPLRRSA